MHLAVDQLIVSLLNSAEPPDPFDTALEAARWWASVQDRLQPLRVNVAAKPRFNPALLAEIRALREVLAKAARGDAASFRFSGDASTDAVLFPLTHAAAAFFSSERAQRLKTCVHDPCRRYFLDETKNGSRRWCSLRCMERARAPRRRTISR
jgi:predicted RNA-binding Zn ribbon-like protein